jgi:TPR repeat protein
VGNYDWLLEMIEVAIRIKFENVTIQSIEDGDLAWEQLLRADPDLLITTLLRDKGLNGWDTISRLAAKQVKFPILVYCTLSDKLGEEHVLRLAGPHLRVKYLYCPFTIDQLYEAISKLLGPSDDPQCHVLTGASASSLDTEALLQQGKNSYFGIGVSQSYAEAFVWFSKAADAGHAEAQFHVALCFEDGDGVKPDQVQAVEWYRKSAIGGFAKAQNNLAICYRDEKGAPRNYAEAEKWYCLAAEQGYAPSSCRPKNESRGHGLTCERLSSLQQPGKMQRMGYYYRYKFGHGAPFEGPEAVRWYRVEAERGCADAQTNLGVCHEFGHGVVQDYAEAARWYRMAAERWSANAQNKLIVGIQSGRFVPLDSDEEGKWYSREDKSRWFKSVLKGVERGEAEEQVCLGLFYEKGFVVPQDYAQAVHWFRKAGAAGHYKLALCYENGHGVPQDYEQAVHWFRKAAERDGSGEYRLGLCYENGHGVPQDYEQAAHWFRKAAERGSDDARCCLGLCYEKGHGVPLDYEQAVDWFHKAGDPARGENWFRRAGAAGQYHLGRCHARGHGVPRNLPEAHKCFKLAAEHGHPKAQEELTVLSPLLTAAELAESERLYDEYSKRAAALFQSEYSTL